MAFTPGAVLYTKADTDGVPYFTETGPSDRYWYADTDGVPYVSSTGPGNIVWTADTDGQPYYSAAPTGVTGSGAITSGTGTFSGSGTVKRTGSGAITSGAGTVSGSGVVKRTGSGAITSGTGSFAGTGSVGSTYTGSGSITSGTGTMSGSGTVKRTGSGSITSGTGSFSGSATVSRTGSGAITSGPGSFQGYGDSGIIGGGITSGTGTFEGVGLVEREDAVTLFDDGILLEDLLYVTLTPDAELDVAVPVLSQKHPAPVLTPSLPVTQKHLDYTPTESVVGFAHIWVDGVDITYFRGKPTLIRNWTKEAPWGDKTALFEMPQLNPWDADNEAGTRFLRADAPVVIGIVDDETGEVTRKWSGFLHSRRRGFDSGESYVFEAHGWMWSAMFQAMEPVPYQPPVDVGVLVPRLLNSLVSRPFKPIPTVTTGILTRYRGSRDEKVWQAVQNILATAFTDDGRQWTLVQVSDDEYRLRLKTPMTDVDFSFAWGNPGIDIDAVTDQDSRVDAVFARGVSPHGAGWANVYYEAATLNDTPYPNASADNDINPGETDADTDSGTGVTDWQERMVDLGRTTMTPSGEMTPKWVTVVRNLQRDLRLDPIDGIVGPQTWAASFSTALDGPLNLAPVRRPMAVKDWVFPRLYDASGADIGPNPNYDPSRTPRFAYLDLGPGVTKDEGRRFAWRHLSSNSAAHVVGSLGFRGCPDDMARTDIDVGHNGGIDGYMGDSDPLVVQVSRISVDLDTDGGSGAYQVTADIDAGARDALTVDQILDRNREALPDPARRPGSPNRSSRQVKDEAFEWDDESPCGVLPRTAMNAGLWVYRDIPFAEMGQLAGIRLDTTVPFAMAGFASLTMTPLKMAQIIGDPFASDDPWTDHLDDLYDKYGLIASWGRKDDGLGYGLGQESEGSSFKGRFIEGSTIEYATDPANAPYTRWFFWARGTSGFIKGRFYPALNRA